MAGVSAKGSRDGIVVDLVAAQERVDSQQGAGAEGVLIAGSDVVGENFLTLVLIGLVERIGHLEPVTRGQQVEVKRVAGGGLPIEAIEDGLAVSHVVKRTEFGAVEKAPAAQGIGGEEIAELLAAEAEGGFLADGSEGAVLRGEAAERLLAESGTGDGVDHEAGLIAEFGAGRAGDEFHGLDGVERNLGGELFALLIGDGLAVDGEAGLCVIAQRVEEAIGIGDDAGAGHGDGVAESVAGGGGGQLRVEFAIHVVVRVGDVFEHGHAAGFHRDGGMFAGQREGNLSARGTLERTATSWAFTAKPVAETATWYGFGGILRKWNAPEASVSGGALVARQRVVEFDLGARNDSAGGVGDKTIDCARGAGRLRSGGECECEIDEPRTGGDGF